MDIPPGEAVGPLDNLRHEDGVAEVYEGEGLDCDDCARSVRHHISCHILHTNMSTDLSNQSAGVSERA